MPEAKKIVKKLLDLFEIYIPTAAFIIMFVAFIIQVFYRYVIRSPLTWSFELCSMSFLWAGMLGACYTLRSNEHVVFGLVYDSLKDTGKHICDLLSGLICAGTLSILLLPSHRYLIQVSSRYPATIRIPFSVLFIPFLLMVIISVGRFLYQAYGAARALIRRGGKNAVASQASEGGEDT